LTLRRDVPNYALYLIAAILLLAPVIIRTARSASFEAARWRESDYGSAIASATKGDG